MIYTARDLGQNREDDGAIVDTPYKYPLKSICRLYSNSDLQPAIGTGVVISHHHILTAGHVAEKADQWIVDQCYHDGHNLPQCIGRTHEIHPSYREHSDLNFDVGIIGVRESLPFPLPPTRWQPAFKDRSVYVCGYSFLDFYHMRFHEGEILEIRENLAAHSCDTYAGQSGSPVIHGGKSTSLFLGLHVGGNEYGSDRFRRISNKCILFTDAIVRWIEDA